MFYLLVFTWIFSTLTVTAPVYADTTTGLIAWWKFEEGVGSSVIDSSGHGNGGTLQNAPSWVNWKLGNAVSLDGVNQYMTIPNSLLQANTVLTVSAWFKTASNGVIISYQNAAYSAGPGNFVPVIYVGTDGKLRAEVWYSGGVNPITTSASVADSKWHQVVLTANVSTQTMYLDGASVGTANGAINNLDMSVNHIGTGYANTWPMANAGWNFFNGSLDDVRIYNRALTAQDVYSLFLGGSRMVNGRFNQLNIKN